MSVAACGSSGAKTSSAPTTASSTASSSSPGSSSTAPAVTLGDGSFCQQLGTFATDLASYASAPKQQVESEAAAFKKLAASAPSSIKGAVTAISNFLSQAALDVGSGNDAGIAQLGQSASQLGADGQQLGTYIAQHCT